MGYFTQSVSRKIISEIYWLWSYSVLVQCFIVIQSPLEINIVNGLNPRSHIISRWSMIVRMSVVLRRTVCGEIDWRLDNLSGSHHQSQVNSESSVYYRSLWSLSWLGDELTMLLVNCQLSRDVIGCKNRKTWLWWWLPPRLSKRRPMSPQTVLLRTTRTRTIILHRLMKLTLSKNINKKGNTIITCETRLQHFTFSFRYSDDDTNFT